MPLYTDFPEIPDGLQETIKAVTPILIKLLPFIQQISQIAPNERTDKEQELVQNMIELAGSLFDIIDKLDRRMLFYATTYFHHVEQLAKEGNVRAKEIYDDLLPAYRAALQENIDENGN